MKKYILLSFAILFMVTSAKAQIYATKVEVQQTNNLVGIATSTPQYTLDVNGSFNATTLNINGQPFTGSVWTQSGNDITYTSGKVGIGITAPLYNLQVNNSSGFSKLMVSSTGGPASFFAERTDGAWGGFSVGTTASAFVFENGTGFYVLEAKTNETPLSPSYIGNPIMAIKASGVAIGFGNYSGPQAPHKLAVQGSVFATTYAATTPPWSDFVFEDEYPLMPLVEVKSYIEQNRHLPDVPSEKELIETGLDLPKMDALLMQKIEEITLYLIDQEQRIQKLEAENEQLRKLINE